MSGSGEALGATGEDGHVDGMQPLDAAHPNVGAQHGQQIRVVNPHCRRARRVVSVGDLRVGLGVGGRPPIRRQS